MRWRRRHEKEDDVPTDDAVANSREVGGVPQEGAADQHSTTGSTPSDTYVGRVAGTDAGYTGETGAEARQAEKAGTDGEDSAADEGER